MKGDPTLRDALNWLVKFFPEAEAAFSEPVIEKMSGGVSNTSYRVIVGDHDWVVRLRKSHVVDYRLDIRVETYLLKNAWAADLVPEVVRGDSESGILVTLYLKGAKPWTPKLARQRGNITRLATRLREFHQIEVNLEAYRPLEASHSYIQAVGGAGGLCARDRDWSEELITLARDYERCYQARVVCHNDLVAANILDDGTLRFVDLEYAVASDPILDLASLVAMNDFDGAQTNHLLGTYYKGEPICSIQSFLDVVRMVRLLSYFWSLSHIQEAEDPSPLNHFAAEIAAMLR